MGNYAGCTAKTSTKNFSRFGQAGRNLLFSCTLAATAQRDKGGVIKWQDPGGKAAKARRPFTALAVQYPAYGAARQVCI